MMRPQRTIIGSSAESGARVCVLRYICRSCHGSELPVSRFPLNRQSFRTFHLFQLTGNLPALSSTLFTDCGCVCYLYRSSVFLGDVNVSAYEARCCGVRGSFAEDAVTAEVFLRSWDGTERRYTEQDFSHVPFWSAETGDSIPQGRGPYSE